MTREREMDGQTHKHNGKMFICVSSSFLERFGVCPFVVHLCPQSILVPHFSSPPFFVVKKEKKEREGSVKAAN